MKSCFLILERVAFVDDLALVHVLVIEGYVDLRSDGSYFEILDCFSGGESLFDRRDADGGIKIDEKFH